MTQEELALWTEDSAFWTALESTLGDLRDNLAERMRGVGYQVAVKLLTDICDALAAAIDGKDQDSKPTKALLSLALSGGLTAMLMAREQVKAEAKKP